MSRRAKRVERIEEIKIDRLNDRGYGVGLLENKEVHVLNALPGEKIKVKIFKKKKGHMVGEALEILKKSKERLEPVESHFESCSPWQIIKPLYENKIKKELITDFFKEYDISIPDFDVVKDKNEYKYRNKVEYSLYGIAPESAEAKAGKPEISLAYHVRETKFFKKPIDSCELMPDVVNEKANKIVKFLIKNKIEARSLKGLLLRYSFLEDKVIACIFSKDLVENSPLKPLLDNSSFEKLLDEKLKGILVIESDFRSPAFVETKVLESVGDTELTEKILGMKFSYLYNGFFQINPAMFEKAAKDIVDYVKTISDHENLVASDIYAGVGTIGLLIAKHVKQLICTEITPNTKLYAEINAKENNIDNMQFFEGKAEYEGLHWIQSENILVLDPPRSGIHYKVSQKIIDAKPKYVIYLSCNPKTQAFDINTFKDYYDIKFMKAYNFYPHTPHVECLIILEKK